MGSLIGVQNENGVVKWLNQQIKKAPEGLSRAQMTEKLAERQWY